METFDDSYNLFKIITDGEEFDSDDEALIPGLLAFRKILANRDWKFLKKSYTLADGNYSLAGIADLDKILRVSLNSIELKKATFEQRFDTSYDYYIDHANNAIVPINTLSGDLIVDYKYRPADFTATSTIIRADFMCPLIAYQMKMDFLDKDQDTETYTVTEKKHSQLMDLLIAYNESL